MSARRDSLYAGAIGKVAIEAVKDIGSGYVVQPKLDGIYSIVSTDRAGRLSSIYTRAGEVLGPALMAEFRGVRWARDSVFMAEAELWTEASNRAAELRGYRMLHAFDAQRVNGCDVSRESYRVRRDALMRAESQLVNDGTDEPWTEDEQGDAHDLKSGRYAKPVPKGWRRVRVVPQLAASAATSAWSTWVDGQDAGPCEGLVAVALDAKIGGRKSKLKAKRASTLDAVVTALSDRALSVFWTAGQRRVAVSRPKSLCVSVGDVVELTHEGFYDSGEPRFARVVRARCDLAA